jgi:intein/homing endonuclease
MIKDKNLLSEFFGILSGDGFLGRSGRSYQVQICGNKTTDYVYFKYFVSPLLNEIMQKKPAFYYSQGAIRLRVYSKKKVISLSAFGFPIGKKGNFGVPNFIMSNKKLWCSFLRGYFDTDGCIYWNRRAVYAKPYPRIQFTSISEKLGGDVFFMLKKLGFKAVLKTRKPGTHKLQYVIELYGHNNLKKMDKFNKLF